MVVPKPQPTVYFAYGSNLWIDQMNRRCPENTLIGIGALKDWRWIINRRGYANIVPSSGDIVYGLVYEMSQTDEANLDKSEGVPVAYVKENLSIDFVPRVSSIDPSSIDSDTGIPAHQIRPVNALIYIDFKRVKESAPKKEYIHRINQGIADATKEGIPRDYFQKFFRPFIPAEETDEAPEVLDPFAPTIMSSLVV